MGRPAINIEGQRFGRLVPLEQVGHTHKGVTLWRCRCDCGKETVVVSCDLRNGHTQSCGCLRTEMLKGHKVHGGRQRKTQGGRKNRLYNIWIAMKQRCYYPQKKGYENYGGRGITVCDEWLHDFVAFRNWALSHGYADTLSIDRIDVNGNYEPSNCRWATAKEQRANQRPRERNK